MAPSRRRAPLLKSVEASIRGMRYEPVQEVEVARDDFITIHCPKTPETVGPFFAARLGHMKRTAFIVNTALAA